MPKTEVSGSQIRDASVALSAADSPTGTADVVGVLPVGNGGTGASTLTGLLKGTGTTAVVAATAGTDYMTPNGAEALTNKNLNSATNTFPTLNQNTTGTAANVTGTVAAGNGGTGLTTPGASGNVLTSNGTTWTSAAPTGGGGGGGSARVINTVTSATTLSAAAGTQYLTYIASGGSVTLPTAVGNTSSYIIKNNDTATKTIATVGDDASFASVTALVQGNGVDASTVFTDSAAKYTWTGAAGVRLSTAVKKFGTASIYFGAGSANNAAISPTGFPGMGASDFTIEMWFYTTVASLANGYYLYDTRPYLTNGVYTSMYVTTGQKLVFVVSAAERITGTTNVTANTWHHAALSRSAGVTRLFLNGVQEGSSYTDANNYLTSNAFLGNTGAIINGTWAGYLDDIRVTLGVGRYTANFTAPTTEFTVPQLIDGTYPVALAPNQAIELTSSGSNWSVVSDAVALPTFTTTPTSATITTLTATSTEVQEFTGVTTHTVRLPSTGIVAGEQYMILNNSTGLLTLQTSSGAQIHILAPGTESILTALVATPTTALHWEDSLLATNYAAGKSLTVNNSLTLQGTDATVMTFPGTSDTVVTLGAAQSLTNKTLTTSTLTSPVINGTPTGTGVATAATANTLVLRGAGGTVTGSFVETTTAVGTIGATTTLALAGTVQTATLTSATPCTVTMPAVLNGASFVLYLRQPATGTPTTATFSSVRWGTNGAPVITAVLGRMDILTFFSDGVYWYGQAAQGYQY